jgi:dipeptidase E
MRREIFPQRGGAILADMRGRILAIGGGTLLDASSRLEDYLLEQSSASRPRVCFLATAVGESRERIELFYLGFRGRACEATHVELFGKPERPGETVAASDIVYVSGGNTANLLALWRLHGIDTALREAWERGAVLAGWSAGAVCWFEDAPTDSFGPRLRRLADGLGFLRGSFCPHYDGEPERRPAYTRLVADGMPAGYAADDDCGLLFENAELREIVAQREGARAYRVTPEGEEPLEARLLR